MNEEFGRHLRTCRVRRGLTQRQLADLSTVSVRAIRDIELNRVGRPRRETVGLIADGLGLTGRSRTHFETVAGRSVPISRLWPLGGDPLPPPAPLDEIVGRAAEVGALTSLLTTGDQRLVTITGLPMAGKTRTALEVARLLNDNGDVPVVWTSATMISATMSAATSGGTSAMRTAAGLGWTSSRADAGLDELFHAPGGVLDELAPEIGDQPMLLVLDGYEAAPERLDRIMPLLHECRRLRVLITSRAAFDVAGERVFPLAPLRVPRPRDDHDPAALATVSAVALLTRHIRQVRPDFALTRQNSAAIAGLCRQLDGLPAALEAAAGWLLVYEPEALLRQVREDPLSFAGRPLSVAATGPADLVGPDTEAEPDIRVLLGRTVDDLDLAESVVLARLAAVGRAWSMDEAVALTGVSPLRCARLVRRLLVRGIVRHAVDEGAGFTVLELIRALYAERRAIEIGKAEPKPWPATIRRRRDQDRAGRLAPAGTLAGHSTR